MNRKGEIKRIEAAAFRCKRRIQLGRIYGRLTEEERIEVHKTQGELMRQHRAAHSDLSPEAYAYMMLLVALDKFDRLVNIQRQRNPRQEDVDKATAISIRQVKTRQVRHRPSPVRDKIEKFHLQVMEKLRKEGLSWRQVAEYLHRQHKIKVSYVYLREIYEESMKHAEI